MGSRKNDPEKIPWENPPSSPLPLMNIFVNFLVSDSTFMEIFVYI